MFAVPSNPPAALHLSLPLAYSRVSPAPHTRALTLSLSLNSAGIRLSCRLFPGGHISLQPIKNRVAGVRLCAGTWLAYRSFSPSIVPAFVSVPEIGQKPVPHQHLRCPRRPDCGFGFLRNWISNFFKIGMIFFPSLLCNFSCEIWLNFKMARLNECQFILEWGLFYSWILTYAVPDSILVIALLLAIITYKLTYAPSISFISWNVALIEFHG